MPNSHSISEDAEVWTRWVSAAPFSAWLCHLSATTGFAPEAIAVAAGVPTSVGRRLAQNLARHHRIRLIDARNLMALDSDKLLQLGARLADSTAASRALRDLGLWRPDPPYLAASLGISQDVAEGLLNGWLASCPLSVIWHCLALTQDIVHARTMSAYEPHTHPAETEPAALAA